MNPENIASIARHWVVTILSAASLWIIGALSLDAGQQQALADATANLTGPLSALVALIVIALWRFVILWVQSVFANKSSGGAQSGGTKALAVSGGMLLAGGLTGFGFFLSGCSPSQMDAVKQVPVKVCYIDKSGARVCYSTKDGLSATVDKRAGAGVTDVDTHSNK